MTAPRFRLARERAGLSIGQAAKLLELAREELEAIEQATSVETSVDVEAFAEVYGVNVPWLIGETTQHDYASVDTVKGADRLSPHDRDVVAEFAAAMPAGTGTAAQRLARIRLRGRR